MSTRSTKESMRQFVENKPAILQAMNQSEKIFATMKGLPDDVSIKGKSVQRVANYEMVDGETMEAMLRHILSLEANDVQEKFIVLSPQFYTLLVKNGPTHDSVIGFTHPKRRNHDGRRNIDVFEKEMICIPIHYSYHFSLVVIMGHNTLITDEINETTEAVIIHLDSSPGLHSTGHIATNVTAWFSEMYKKRENNCLKFISERKVISELLSVVAPDVHYQTNGVDCGMHVLFFFQLLLLRRPIVPTLSDIQNGMQRFFVRSQFSDKDMFAIRKYILNTFERHQTFEKIKGDVVVDDDDDDVVIIPLKVKMTVNKKRKKVEAIVIDID
jgi:Ulp1 family protease